MRVAFSVHAYSPSIGGAERYAQGLAEGLAALGHEVHVVTADVDDPEAFYELGHETIGPAEEVIDGVTVHRVPYGNLAIGGWDGFWGRSASFARRPGSSCHISVTA